MLCWVLIQWSHSWGPSLCLPTHCCPAGGCQRLTPSIKSWRSEYYLYVNLITEIFCTVSFYLVISLYIYNSRLNSIFVFLPLYIIAIAYTLLFVTVYSLEFFTSKGSGSILYFVLFTRPLGQRYLMS